MTSSSQTKPREPYSYIYRKVAYVLSLILTPLNFAALTWHRQLELSAAPVKYTPILAPMVWFCVPLATLCLCVDEFAKDRCLLPLMYPQFYLSTVFLHRSLIHTARQEDGIVIDSTDVEWMVLLYLFTEGYYSLLARLCGATDYDVAPLRFYRLHRECLVNAFQWSLARIIERRRRRLALRTNIRDGTDRQMEEGNGGEKLPDIDQY
ncbi:hypothetical protein VKT23_003496 [Stygiomarasmius scandens]|uniref:Uncharacterized protein n=1 Tax=Marasmiellus scandens TaxID=2682957 RepID=A0ABR1JXV3_9AGAR